MTDTPMSPRARRLLAESQALSTEFAGHPHITVTPITFEPADSYRISYRLRGVTYGPSGQLGWSDNHGVRIHLGASYPRAKPLVIMETPIFHPNIGSRVGEEVCIGDYWSPGESLVDVVVTIGELIQYQRYNVRSPLNAIAARWAAENEHIFPVGKIILFQAEPTVTVRTGAPGPPPGSTLRGS
jgi:ubiquitin-protein ligase